MYENGVQDNYVSSIKVKGIHLLPPVITAQRRVQLQRYKQQAIKLEKRIQTCKELKKNLEDLLNNQSLLDRPESEITFRGNSHVELLGISEKVPFRRRNITLSRDVIDVTEYNNDGIKIIDCDSDANDLELKQGHTLSFNSSSEAYETDTSQPTSNKIMINEEPDIHCPLLDLSELVEQQNLEIDKSIRNGNNTSNCNIVLQVTSPKCPKPRLIRSNSYILESPSPILLAHLQKSKTEVNTSNGQPNDVLCNHNWSSLENNYIPSINSEPSSINTVYHNEEYDLDVKKTPTIDTMNIKTPVQQIPVNAHDKNGLVEAAFDLTDPDSQLMKVLRKIPKDYSKEIIELIENHRLDNVKVVDKLEDKLNPKNSNENIQNESPNRDNIISRSSVSISPTESLQYSISTSDNLAPSSPLELIDIKQADDSSKNMIDLFINSCIKTKPPTNRELLPELDAATVKTIKQEWAASIIGAHVKGYLTRRLLKTEKVQSLIETIKDALLCALQLHTAENIDESDVELHRRLINQVSAACYAFHDIFFSLTVREQMTMISMDRQRKIERAKRPLSAHTPRSSRTSSRSSGRQLTPHSRSLTKV